MALSAAERQRLRRQRIKSDPQRHAEEKENERKRWLKRKQKGTVTGISNMNKKEKLVKRTRWRESQKRCRERKKAVKTFLLTTPPTSPLSDPNESQPSRQRLLGERRRRRQNEKRRREIEKLENQLQNEKRRAEKYKKRWQRLKSSGSSLSPRRKVAQLLKHSSTASIRRTLLFHSVLVDQIKQHYKATKSERLKRLHTRLFAGDIIKKYKLKHLLQTQLGITPRVYQKAEKKRSRRKINSFTARTLEKLTSFFIRDDVSRLMPGKKDTITRHKVRKQKRLLQDSLLNLHAKFCAENVEERISYSMFCRQRPFWVVFPSASDRETCLCKTHENMNLLLAKLHKLCVIKSKDASVVIKDATCNTNQKDCMYGVCDDCKTLSIEVNPSAMDMEQQVSWYQWKTIRETRDIHGTMKTISVTKKIQCSGTVHDLVDEVNNLMVKFKRHFFNIVHQFKMYKALKESLKENECLLHIDFSENYSCKSTREIQSVHFGASANQISLHTGIYYTTTGSRTFCTVSDSLVHGPAGIWAHLDPILDDIQHQYPKINVLHVYSDGPTTQYRQKGNFYLFQHSLKRRHFKHGSWNFLEAGHGKGIPDGVGGTIKRVADSVVLHGKDISSGMDFYSEVQKHTSIHMHFIKEERVSDYEKLLASQQLYPVPNTMKLHQIFVNESDLLYYRDVSCICQRENTYTCNCFDLKKIIFPGPQDKIKEPNQSNDIDGNSEREKYFKDVLKKLQKCKTFAALTSESNRIQKKLQYELPQTDSSTALGDQTPDEAALKLLPSDISSDLMPITTTADGDCLPYTGSLLIFGHDRNSTEVRARIVMELAMNKKKYLDPEILRSGQDITDKEAKLLSNDYSMYSDFFNGQKLTPNTISTIYCKEVMHIRTEKTFMGIWQIIALANIMGHVIKSVYPQKGNPNVRKHLNRCIVPASLKSDQTKFIMWTSTRAEDMIDEHFVPNHFVPLVKRSQSSGSKKPTSLRKPDQALESLLGKFVVVRYDDQIYPGLVIDEDVEDVQVKCMHRIGANRFFWPPRDDVCYYSLDDVLGVIPEPEDVTGRHKQVQPDVWKKIKDTT